MDNAGLKRDHTVENNGADKFCMKNNVDILKAFELFKTEISGRLNEIR